MRCGAVRRLAAGDRSASRRAAEVRGASASAAASGPARRRMRPYDPRGVHMCAAVIAQAAVGPVDRNADNIVTVLLLPSPSRLTAGAPPQR
jgi:hypothetical protein